MRHAWIVSIGTELTAGQTVDTNAAWIAARLVELGIVTERHVTVPDALGPIRDVLREATRAVKTVVVTGGLGPTPDDLTRNAVAAVAGVPLETDEAIVEHLRAYFAERNRAMAETNLVQAQVPQGAQPIQNPRGTAPGLDMTIGDARVFVLPGVPSEMRGLFADYVAPVLRRMAEQVIRTRRLNVFGMGESDVAVRIGELMSRGRNPEVGTTAADGVIGVRLTVRAADTASADALLDETEAELRTQLDDVVFSVDDVTVAEALEMELARSHATLATAESCTGGMIGKLLTDVPGSSAVYLGGVVTYSNTAKAALLNVPTELLARHGAVSEPVAAAMAQGAVARFGSTHAVSVTGVAGPGGGSDEKPVGLVFIGVSSPEATIVRRRLFGATTSREVIRMRAALTALDGVRRCLRGDAWH